MIFEILVTSKDARTAELGNIYSYINGLSLFIQFIIIPYLLSRVTNKFVFFSIPIIYSGLSFLTMGLGASSIILAGGAFVFMKASDYSIFSYSKEVLYHGLTNAQKYGAKYITDMFAYRLAKALIAGVMSFVEVERIEILNMFQVLFILVWIICVYILFKNQKEE
jgi:AAA family ATP:ADP antiporter